MNERIRELKRQAWDFVQHDLETVERDHAVLEQEQRAMVDAKFAELLIQECADFLKDKLDDHFAAEQLEEHFGVEE